MNDRTLLIPGSVWKRERNGKTAFASVVGITNSHLSPELAEKNGGERVIYIDQKGRWNSLPVDRFLKSREFYNQSEAVADNVANILAEDDEITFDDPAVIVESETQTSEEEIPPYEDEQFAVQVAFIQEDAEQQPSISPQTLIDSIVNYSQTPNIPNGSLQHELLFAVDGEEVTYDSLRYAFSTHNPGGFAAFQFGDDLTQWDMFLGVYPVFTVGGTYAKVIFETHTNFQEDSSDEDDGDDEEVEVPTETEVQTQTSADISAISTESPPPPADVQVKVTSTTTKKAAPKKTTPKVSAKAQSVASQIVQQ